MKQRFIRWRDKSELKELIAALEAEGYENAGKLTADYDFPVIVADDDRKCFFGTNTACIAARASALSRLK